LPQGLVVAPHRRTAAEFLAASEDWRAFRRLARQPISGSPSRSSLFFSSARLHPLNAGSGAAVFGRRGAASEDWW